MDPIGDQERLGDALDEYLDLGGGLVLLPFCMSNDSGTGSLGGRLPQAPDFPVHYGRDDEAGLFQTVPKHVPQHPVLTGVDPFRGAARGEKSGLLHCGRHRCSLRGGATALASYEDGVPLVAMPTAVHPKRGRLVVVNLEPEDVQRCGMRLLWNTIGWVKKRHSKAIQADASSPNQTPEGASHGHSPWLLDGYPQIRDQALALEAAGVRPEILLVVSVPLDHLLEQHGNRWFDPLAKRSDDL